LASPQEIQARTPSSTTATSTLSTDDSSAPADRSVVTLADRSGRSYPSIESTGDSASRRSQREASSSALGFDFASFDFSSLLPPASDKLKTLFVGTTEAARRSANSASDSASMAASSPGENTRIALKASGAIVGLGISWGSLRLAGLLGSAMATRPVWENIDPIPLLPPDEDVAAPDPKRQSTDDEEADDEAAACDLLDEVTPSERHSP
jgi:hypothetical protein